MPDVLGFAVVLVALLFAAKKVRDKHYCRDCKSWGTRTEVRQGVEWRLLDEEFPFRHQAVKTITEQRTCSTCGLLVHKHTKAKIA